MYVAFAHLDDFLAELEADLAEGMKTPTLRRSLIALNEKTVGLCVSYIGKDTLVRSCTHQVPITGQVADAEQDQALSIRLRPLDAKIDKIVTEHKLKKRKGAYIP
jgi:hypothetical protein